MVLSPTGGPARWVRETGPMTVEPLRTSFRRQVREQAIAAALELTTEHGWDGVRMSRVAEMAGVSRPTLYKEFGDKQGLADALSLAESERFVAGVVRELVETPGAPEEVLRAVLEHCLAEVARSPLLQEAVRGSGGAGLLPQLTTRSAPTLELAARDVTPWLAGHFPDLPPAALGEVVDTLVRLVLSHAVLPGAPDAAGAILRVALAMLGVPGPRP